MPASANPTASASVLIMQHYSQRQQLCTPARRPSIGAVVCRGRSQVCSPALLSGRGQQLGNSLGNRGLHLGVSCNATDGSGNKAETVSNEGGGPAQETPSPARARQGAIPSAEDVNKRRLMEDELRDPRTFVEYFLPRPLRLALFGGGAASCFIAVLLAVSKLLEGPAALVLADGTASNLGVNLCGLVVFLALFSYDLRAAERRKERRKMVRDAQIKFGDREVFYTAEGQKMSILKEVNADWIIRRLDRWGKRDGMPFLGPEKGALLEQLVQERQPQLVVEVGTLCGYSAIRAGRVLPEGGRVVTMEKDFLWMLAAKRFIWQAQLSDKVDVQWGDAKQLLQKLPQSQKIDLLFLDGLPKETLEYLKAAEPMLAPGAMVVADNAGVFAEGGLKPYLQYVRNSPQYQSRLLETPLQWRDDVQDGMEVSTFCAP